MNKLRSTAFAVFILSIVLINIKPALSESFYRIIPRYPPCHLMMDIPYGDISHGVIDNKTVFYEAYIGDDNRILYGLDVENGQIQFKIYIGNAKYCTYMDTIYIADNNGVLIAKKPTGEIMWQMKLSGAVIHKPIISNQRLYLVTIDNSIFALDVQSGSLHRELSKKSFEGNLFSPPVVKDGRIYIVTSRGVVYEIANLEVNERARIDRYVSEAPVFANDRMFVASKEAFFEIDLRSGTAKEYTSGVKPIRQIAVAGKGFLIIAGDGKVECFDSENLSNPLWQWSGTYQSVSSDKQNVYIGANDVCALDAETGTEKWRYNEVTKRMRDEKRNEVLIKQDGYIAPEQEIDIIDKFPMIESNVAFPIQVKEYAGEKTILANTENRWLYAMDSEGEKKWNFRAGEPVSANFGLGKSSLFMGTSKGVCKIELLDMGLSCFAEVGDAVLADPVVDEDRDSIYFVSVSGNVYKYSLSNQEEIWEIKIKGAGRLSPILNEEKDRLFISTNDGDIYALNVEDGSKAWEEEFTAGSSIRYSPLFYNNRLYVSSDDQELHVVDPETGREIPEHFDNITEIWTKKVNRVIGSSVCVVGGMLYLGSEDYKLHAFDIKSEAELWKSSIKFAPIPAYAGIPKLEEKWTYQAGGSIESKVSVSSGIVYFTCMDGYIYAVDESSGSFLWRYPTYGKLACQPQVRSGKIYVVSPLATLYVFQVADTPVPESRVEDILGEYKERLTLDERKQKDSEAVWEKLYLSYRLDPMSYENKRKIWEFLKADWSKTLNYDKVGFSFRTQKDNFFVYIEDGSPDSSIYGDVKMIYLLQLMLGRDYISEQARDQFYYRLNAYERKKRTEDVRKDIGFTFLNPSLIFGDDVNEEAAMHFEKCRRTLNGEGNSDFSYAANELRQAMAYYTKGEKVADADRDLRAAVAALKDGQDIEEIIDESRLIRYLDYNNGRMPLTLARIAWIRKYTKGNKFSETFTTRCEEALKESEAYLDSSELYYYLGRMYEEEDSLEEAEKYYNQSIALGRNVLSYYRLGNIYFTRYLRSPSEKKLLKDAEVVYDIARSNNPKSSEDVYDKITLIEWSEEGLDNDINLKMGLAYAHDADYDGAKEFFEDVLDKQSDPNIDEKLLKAASLNLMAIYAHDYYYAVTSDPDDKKRLREKIEMNLSSDKLKPESEIINYYLSLASDKPGVPMDNLPGESELIFPMFYHELRYRQGSAWESKGIWQKAIYAYESFLHEHLKDSPYSYPSESEYAYHVGRTYYMAIYHAESKNPSPRPVYWLAEADTAREDERKSRYLENAVKWLKTAQKYDKYKNSDEVRKWLGDAYYALGMWQEALEVFENLGEEDYRIIQCYIGMKRYDKADRLAGELVDKQGDDPIAWYLYALALEPGTEPEKFRLRKEKCKENIENMRGPAEKGLLLELLTRILERGENERE